MFGFLACFFEKHQWDSIHKIPITFSAPLSIDDLCQPSHFHLLTTKTAEVLHNDRTNQTVLYHFLHLLKAFPLEGSAGYAVVYKELRVPIAFPTGEVL